MPITLDIKKDSLLSLPTGLYRFKSEKPNNILLLEKEDTGLELRLPEYTLVDMLGRGKAKVIDFFTNGELGPEQTAAFGPGEDWIDEDKETAKLTDEGRRALALQFYTIKWDESADRSLGDIGLARLIAKWRPVTIGMKLESNSRGAPRVQPARLKHAVNHLGSIGQRPLWAFRSRRGKTPRKRFDNVVDTMLAAAADFYWQVRMRDYNDCYAKFRTEIEQLNADRATAALAPLRFPTRPEVLRRRIQKMTNAINWARKYSPTEAHKKFKGIKDGLVATYPLELTIMDSTTMDTWTVLDTSTYLPLGRPTLTVNIDVATRCILGYLITFEPPSLYSALTTLKRANKNKSYMKSLYPHIAGRWDSWGRGEELLLDNAWENKAPSLKHSLANMGISLTWAPVRTGQYKAIGERFFRTVNTMLFHKLSGAVPYNPHMMRQVGVDPKAGRIMTLGDMDALMHEAITVYHGEKHEGLGAIPGRIWRDKIAIRKRHFIADITVLDHVLGRVETGRLTTSGIKFRNMNFHDPEITSALLDDLVHRAPVRDQSDKPYAPGRVNVVFKWNPADASSISVWNDGGSPPQYVTLPNRDPKFTGISFWHWEQIKTFAEQQDLDYHSEADRWKARDELRRRWEAIAGKMPMRKSRDARRGLAFSQGQFDETNVNRTVDIDPDTVIESEALRSTTGFNQPEGVPDELAVTLLNHINRPDKGRTPSKQTTAKAMRTRAANSKEKEREREHAEFRELQGNPSGNPVTSTSKKTMPLPSPEPFPAAPGWEDDVPEVAAQEATLAVDASNGWDDDFE